MSSSGQDDNEAFLLPEVEELAEQEERVGWLYLGCFKVLTRKPENQTLGFESVRQILDRRERTTHLADILEY